MTRAFFCHCGAISKTKTCSKHRAADTSTHNSTARGYDYAWQQCREAYMDEHPCCEDCEEQGITRPAEHVHHVTPINEAWALRLDWTNLAALCERCHEARHGKGTRPAPPRRAGAGF